MILFYYRTISLKNYNNNIIIIMKIISFGDISWFMVFPFLGGIALSTNFFILPFLFECKLRHQLFLFANLVCLSKLSMGILSYISNRIINRTKNTQEEQALLINEDSPAERTSSVEDFAFKKENTKTYYILMTLLCGCLHYIYYFFDFSFRYINGIDIIESKISSKHYGFSIIILQIILYPVLNHFLLKYPTYRHHIVSLFIMVVCSLVYLSDIVLLKEGDRGMFFFLSAFIINSVQFVIEKVLMESKYISPYQIIFYEGVIEFALNIITCILYHLFSNSWELTLFKVVINNFSELTKQIKANYLSILFFFLYFIQSFVYELSLTMSNFYLNPNYYYIIIIISILIIWGFEMIVNGTETFFLTYSPKNIICYFIVLIGAMIYNEIIILYFGGMERNTKKEIKYRATTEEENEIEIYNHKIITPLY